MKFKYLTKKQIKDFEKNKDNPEKFQFYLTLERFEQRLHELGFYKKK